METVIRIPTLQTERFNLRAPKPEDFEVYASFRSGPRSHFVGGPHSRDDAFSQFCALIGHWHARGYGRWIIADPETDTPLGTTGPYYPESWLAPEIAWTVFDGNEGRGIATEAAKAARAYAYQTLGWTSVISLIVAGNTRSEALATRLGATREGVFHHETIGALNVWRHPSADALGLGGA